MKNVQGSMLINTLSSQIAELSAVITSGIVFANYGAINGLSYSYMCCLIGATVLTFISGEDNETAIPIFVGIAKFGISAAFNMNFISFMELIPTIFVSTVLGYANIFARGVTIVAPMVAELTGILPDLITCCMASAAGICSLYIL